MRLFLLAPLFGLGFAAAANADDYASAINAYRRANGLSAVKADGGNFSSRVAGLRKSRAAENIGAGFLTFAEMLKQWKDSRGHRENLLMPGARRVGAASVDNPRSPYRKFWAMVITD